MRVVQVTDTHIGETPALVNGIDVREQFQAVLAEISQTPMDLLVMSGDLAAEAGEPGAYQWLAEQLKAFPAPIAWMAGNHDETCNMRQFLPIAATDFTDDLLYFKREIQGHTLLFLDSSPDDKVTDIQLDWLQREAEAINKEFLLFIHHPPLIAGCRFMDKKYPLRNIDKVWPVLRDIPNLKHIFCGHYHTERTVLQDGKCVHITPSTKMQIAADTEDFDIQHTNPGWREINWDGETLEMRVNYTTP